MLTGDIFEFCSGRVHPDDGATDIEMTSLMTQSQTPTVHPVDDAGRTAPKDDAGLSTANSVISRTV
jgi:hypothetical protein